MGHLAQFSPQRSIGLPIEVSTNWSRSSSLTYHEHNSELASRDVVCCIRLGTIRVDRTALIQQLFDDFHTTQHDHWPTGDHETVDGTIFPGPFSELDIFVFARDLARCQACTSLPPQHVPDVSYRELAK